MNILTLFRKTKIKIIPSVLTCLVLFFGYHSSIAQDHNNVRSLSSLQYADQLFQEFQIKKALKLYQGLYEKSTNEQEVGYLLIKIALSERLLNNPTVSTEYFEKYLQLYDSLPSAYQLNYAQDLATTGRYKEAEEAYRIYGEQSGSMALAQSQINFLQKLENSEEQNEGFQLSLLDINSEEMDFSPALYNDGIVFVSNRAPVKGSGIFKPKYGLDETHYLDLYYSERISQTQFEAPVPFHKNINTSFHEGPSSFYNQGRSLFFTSNFYDKKGKPVQGRDGTVHLAIYHTNYNSRREEWTEPTHFPFNDPEYSVGHPSISEDGLTLYFTANMPGGFGGTDIYKVSRSHIKGPWSAPENLGSAINTSENEQFPFIHKDNVLFFASDGHGGIGGMDIFRFDFNQENALSTNVGYPMNSSADDFGLCIYPDKFEGYFTSNRNSDLGKDNIYHFFEVYGSGIPVSGKVVSALDSTFIPNAAIDLFNAKNELIATLQSGDEGQFDLLLDPGQDYQMVISKYNTLPDTAIIPLSSPDLVDPNDTMKAYLSPTELLVGGRVLEGSTNQPLQYARLLVIDDQTGEVFKYFTKADGRYSFIGEAGKKYRILAEQPAYFSTDLSIDLTDVSLGFKPQNIFLNKISIGEFVRLDDIYYDSKLNQIRKDAIPALSKLLELLKVNPTIFVEISSHSDARGTDSYNLQLSQQRAEAVVKWLTDQGIDPYRLHAKGYGETKLVNDCDETIPCTEEQHQANRRTEFAVTRFLGPMEAFGEDEDFLFAIQREPIAPENMAVLTSLGFELPPSDQKRVYDLEGFVHEFTDVKKARPSVLVQAFTDDGYLVAGDTTDDSGTFKLELEKVRTHQIRFSGKNLSPQTIRIFGNENLEKATKVYIPIKENLTRSVPVVVSAKGSKGNARIRWEDLTNGEYVVKSVPIGKPLTFIAEKGHDYEVITSAKGYFTKKDLIKSANTNAIARIELEPIALGVQRPLDIKFKENRYSITSNIAEKLRLFGQFIKENNLSVSIKVHTDPRGNQLFLLDMSQRRARAIKEYLVRELNIPESQLKVTGVGAEEPINGCKSNSSCSEEEFLANERLDYTIR